MMRNKKKKEKEKQNHSVERISKNIESRRDQLIQKKSPRSEIKKSIKDIGPPMVAGSPDHTSRPVLAH